MRPFYNQSQYCAAVKWQGVLQELDVSPPETLQASQTALLRSLAMFALALQNNIGTCQLCCPQRQLQSP